jgi:hypothetical protein
MKPRYPGYDVLDKWSTVSFDDRTRSVLEQRLRPEGRARFLSRDERSLLEAICDRVVPQPERAAPVPIAALVDEQLARDRREGFRKDDMPVQREAWRRGLAGIDHEARRRHGAAFVGLAPPARDDTLRAVQCGDVDAAAWQVPAARFFVDVLLKTVAGLYYAHPTAWSEIGFGGPASPRGYVRLGFDERDPWEAKEAR